MPDGIPHRPMLEPLDEPRTVAPIPGSARDLIEEAERRATAFLEQRDTGDECDQPCCT